MSTSGGSKGERHAKPKFQTIDINTLHRSSRGETLEPSQQKNQAPRKHGMQSLGKVPSARRPPANLPSLKAETLSPIEQQGSWGGATGPTDNQQNSISQNIVQPPIGISVSSTSPPSTTNSSTSSSAGVAPTPAHIITNNNNQQTLNQSSGSQQTSNSNNTLIASSNNSNNNINTLPSNTVNSLSSSTSTTWSSVTTGNLQEVSGQPPLYQSPQFQHEFPSLDGSTVTGTKASHHQQQHSTQQQQHASITQSGNIGGGMAGGIQMPHQHQQEMSLRPQTNVGSWMQQQHQQQGGNGNRAGENIANGPNSQQGPAHPNQVPLHFRSLMPAFMVRGGSGNGGPLGSGGGPSYGVSMQNQMPPNYSQTQARPRSQPGAQSQPMYEHNFYGGNQNMQQQPRRNHAQQSKRQQHDDRSPSLPINEPEIIHQRPIIKEEDLERLDSLAKDDGWANPDDIDYNKKLQFSDDECCDDERSSTIIVSTQKNDNKKHNQNQHNDETEDDKRAGWREREKNRQEHERMERERNEKNERDRNINATMADKDRDRTQSQQLQQNGSHRNEQDFNNDNRFNNDRRNNNNNNSSNSINDKTKKYTDIDSQKLGAKPTHSNVLKKSPSDRDFSDRERDRPERDEDKRILQQQTSDEYRTGAQIGDRDRIDRDRDRMERDRGGFREKDNSRHDYRYDKYDRMDRDTNSRERDGYRMENRERDRDTGADRASTATGGNGAPFSRQFQSNLPPRFQKQQMERGGSAGNNSSNNYIPTNRNNPNASNFHQNSNNDKSIPFAQQYDARYIHSNYKSQQQSQSIRRNPSDEMMSNRRRRGDSEDEDRFSSGRESVSRNSITGGQTTPQLARSISDSSQRKTSVSSEEKMNCFDTRIERSESRELQSNTNVGSSSNSVLMLPSWADEMDVDIQMLKKYELANLNNNLVNNKTESNDNLRSSKESINQQEEPIKQILQRSNSKTTLPSSLENSFNSSTKETTAKNIAIKEDGPNIELPATASSITSHYVKEKSPKSWADSVPDASENSASPPTIDKPENLNVDDSSHKKSLESIPESKTALPSANETNKENKNTVNENKLNENVNTQAQQPLTQPNEAINQEQKNNMKRLQQTQQPLLPSRGGRGGGGEGMRGNDNRQSSNRDNRGGYSNNYRSWNHHNNRGGRSNRGRYNENHNWSDTDGSDNDEEYMSGRRPERSPKVPRKDNQNRYDSSRMNNDRQSHGTKEGFAPRGEPSRRGRGGNSGSLNSNSSFRRGGLANASTKRIEGYGPPSSKSPFSQNEDKLGHGHQNENKQKDNVVEDKTKLNQIALTSGLMSSKPSGNFPNRKDETAPSNNNNKTSITTSANVNNNNNGKNNNDKKISPPKVTQPSVTVSNNTVTTTTAPKTVQPINNNNIRNESQSVKKDDTSNNNKTKKDETNSQPQRSQQQSNVVTSTNKPKDSINSNIKQTSNNQLMKSNSAGGNLTSQQTASNLNNNINQKSSFGGPNQSATAANINKSTKPIPQNQNNRQNNKLPPRFMKQQIGNRSGSSPSNSEINGPQNVSISNNNAWEKPLNTSSLRHNENELLSMSNSSSSNVYDQTENNELNINENHSSPSNINKTDSNINKQQPQPLLDGSTAPVTTIIFENTNFKAVPQAPIKRQQQNSPQPMSGQQSGSVLKSSDPNNDVVFLKQTTQSQNSLQNIIDAQGTPESITSALSNMTFPSSKCDSEYEKEMKMAFTFDSDLSQLTDDKTPNVSSVVTGKPGGPVGLIMPRTMHSVTSSGSQIHPSTAELNMKIASVKKVWENAPAMSTVLEQQDDHSGASHLTSNFVTSQHQTHIHQYVQHGNMVTHTLSPGPSYSATFGPDPSALEQHFSKQDGGVEQEYSQGQQHNVGQNHAQHQNQNLNLVKHAAEALATNNNVCKVKPNQQQLHQSSLAGLSPPPMQQGTLQAAPQPYYPPTQFGNMSAIPSPPAVLFNSSAMPSQGGLYTQFQIEAGRSQYSQYPTHYGASNAPYNAYMQTPPNIQAGPTPEMFQNMAPPYRMPQTVQSPFNQNQQLNNPNTVLISSSSNSLMSASVKPSSQQIGAIGSKTATVGHPIGQQYMNMYAQQAPPLQSNSYYSNSAGNQGAFFGGPGAGTAQSYSLQAPAMFGGHGGPAPSNAPQQQPVANFSSQFLSSPLLTTAINQQYRGAPTQQAAAAYIKSNQQQSHIQDPTGRQLKSPLNPDGGLIVKQPPPPQTSPPQHKKFPPSWELQNQVLQQQTQQNRNSGTGNTGLSVGRPGGPPPQQQGQHQRYIAPIQRPTNYPQPQQNMVSQNRNPRLNVSQSNCGPNKHYINPNSSGGGGGGGRGTHGHNTSDPNVNKVTNNEKNVDGLGGGTNVTVNSQDGTAKVDGQKE